MNPLFAHNGRSTKSIMDFKSIDNFIDEYLPAPLSCACMHGLTEAADILQELQVETFGSMERREKVEFILEQVCVSGC